MGELLDDVQTELLKEWERHDCEHTDADWEALYKQAIALPCFKKGLSVACTLQRPRDTRRLSPEVTAFFRYPDRFAPTEQALDLLALDPEFIWPWLGAEIEFTSNKNSHVKAHDEVLRIAWGEHVPKEGYFAEVLYDLGRLLAVNPTFMVLVVTPPGSVQFGPIIDHVRKIYNRVAGVRNLGGLLLMIDQSDEFPPKFHRFGEEPSRPAEESYIETR